MEDTTRQPSRKERERQAHRHEILDAAETVFIRNGYYHATVEQIAQEAEFAVGTLYNFFKGKGEMYAQVIERIAEEFMVKLDSEVLSLDDPIEALTALIELRLRHFEAHRGFFRVFFESSPGSHMDPVSALPDSCKGLYERYLGEVSKIVERGIASGMFRKTDPLCQALCIEGIVNASVSYWSRQDTLDALATRIAKMTDALLAWIRTGKD